MSRVLWYDQLIGIILIGNTEYAAAPIHTDLSAWRSSSATSWSAPRSERTGAPELAQAKGRSPLQRSVAAVLCLGPTQRAWSSSKRL
eukprot:1522427-Pyramimonas_sp.AAC.1